MAYGSRAISLDNSIRSKTINSLVSEVIMLIMFGLGIPEIIAVLVIVLVVFGAGRLPGIMGSIGKGIGDFKKAMREPEKREGTALSDNKDKDKDQEKPV